MFIALLRFSANKAAENVVSAEILEITLGKADDRLKFLLA